MNIIETNFNYKSNHTTRTLNAIDRIILHHSASNVASAEQIHQWHLSRGYAGAGYHFLVRKDGSVYTLRPVNWVGAHCQGYNTCSIGICAEGNFEEETMNEVQKNAIIELVNYLKAIYRINKVTKHNDYGSTACPGRNYPFNEIINAQTINESTAEQPTDNSVLNYQKAFNKTYGYTLAEDNIKGINTNNSINKVLLKRGSRNELVKWCQERLRAHKGYSIGIDGIYGTETERVVRQFQRDNGLINDGIIGKNTISILF